MNIKDTTRLIKLAMKADVPYLLVGHSGLGKTQITGKIAEEVFPDHKFVTIMASQQDVGDFIGIPDIKDDAEGNRVTSWARPEWMPYEPCVIFLDELNNARPDVESAMLQLVLEKRIHTHTLHPNSYICAAINPASAEYSTANTMTTALVKRFMVIAFEPEVKEFITYSEESGTLHPSIIAFLKHQPSASGADKKLDTLIKMEPCPRLWTNAASKMLYIIEREGKIEDRDLIKDAFASSVGLKEAIAFLSFLDSQEKPLSYKEITTDPEAALKKLNVYYEDMRTDLVSSTVENIILGFKGTHEEVVNSINYKTSILEVDRNADPKLVQSAIEELNHNVKNNLGVNRQKLDNLISFLEKCPNDLVYQVSHALITNKPFVEQNGQSDKEYHEQQLKRFNAYNTIIFYLYREDLIPGHKGIHARFLASTQEVAKHKKQVNE